MQDKTQEEEQLYKECKKDQIHGSYKFCFQGLKSGLLAELLEIVIALHS